MDKQLAGAASVDISPDRLGPLPVWMGGYMPVSFATGQLDPISVRALALGGPEDGLLVVAIDTCLIGPVTAARWSAAIRRRVPLPADRIFIVTTHTHSGPDFSWLFGGVPPHYFMKAARGVVRAARLAWAARRPASLFVGSAGHDLGIPRRIKEGQTDRDREAIVLQWRDGAGTVATLINLGCHGVVLPLESRLLSSDLPGALCRKSDAAFGGVSLFVPRIQGDVNPNLPGKNPYQQYGNPKELERLAREGIGVIKAAVSAATPVRAAPISVSQSSVETRSIRPVALLLGSSVWTGRPAKFTGRRPIEFQKFSIGEIEGIAAPGEALTCLGRRLLEKIGGAQKLLFSYTGGYRGYLMTPEEFEAGGYEPNVSPGPIDPEKIVF
jgi:hypothetical protein